MKFHTYSYKYKTVRAEDKPVREIKWVTEVIVVYYYCKNQ